MIRCFAEPAQWRNDSILLTPDESHHLKHVLRMNPGDPVRVLDGCGVTAETVIEHEEGKALVLRIDRREQHEKPHPGIVLYQALSKGPSMDLIVQKAVELGASRIVPVLADRSQVRLDEHGKKKKQARWAKTVVGALKQCGAPWKPELAAPLTFDEALADGASIPVSLLCSLEPGAGPLRDAIDKDASAIGVWVGPEGDFSANESAALRDAGARPVSLGPRVLRVETATLYVLSVLSFALNR